MTYTKNREGYLIPSLSLPNQPNPYLNRYARLRLEYLEQNDQQYNRDDHDIRLPSGISIPDRDSSQSAASNGTRHGRISKNGSQRNSCSNQERCSGFYQKHFGNDPKI